MMVKGGHRWTRGLAVTLIFTTIAPFAAAETVLQATAYVTLVNVPPRVVSHDGTPVQQSASGEGSSAHASASETSVGSRAYSQDGNLVEGAFGSASARTTFRVTSSGSGASVPLTFNLGVSGSIYATSNLIPQDSNISVVSVNIRSNVDNTQQNGAILMGSRDGYLVLYSTSGTFGAGGAAEGVVRAELEVRLADPLDAIPFELLTALGSFTIIGRSLSEVTGKIDDLIAVIEATAERLGFPGLNIGPGKVVPVWTVKYFIDNNVPITVPIVPNDGGTHFMGLSIITQAATTPVASGAADYANTIEVTSVTVDSLYRGNPSDIVIEFESGRVIRATRDPVRRRAVRH